jgi:DNA-binding transcriptional regulator YiaG
MIHAYQETYVDNAMSLMGDMIDYVVNDCNMDADLYFKLFLSSIVCKAMENGNPKYILGCSGIDIAKEVVFDKMGKTLTQTPQERFSRSPEYWAGWAIAYYQWFSVRKFSEIHSVLPFSILTMLYSTLHEADISKFVSVANKKMKEAFPDTRLKTLRTVYGYSQSELAKASGVGLRSIQMYEQRNKDINKASGQTLKQLSSALGCAMEDLLEPNWEE